MVSTEVLTRFVPQEIISKPTEREIIPENPQTDDLPIPLTTGRAFRIIEIKMTRLNGPYADQRRIAQEGLDIFVAENAHLLFD